MSCPNVQSTDTNDKDGVVIGAFTAAAYYGVGTAFGNPDNLTAAQSIAKAGAHGLIGGASSVLQGGKFIRLIPETHPFGADVKKHS